MTRQPHDALVKAASSRPENAIGALRAVLPPALLKQLDLTTLKTSAHDTFVDDASLRALFSHLVFDVQLAGRPALCFVLYEHQSAEDPRLIVRLDAYKAGVWRRWLADHPDARADCPIACGTRERKRAALQARTARRGLMHRSADDHLETSSHEGRTPPRPDRRAWSATSSDQKPIETKTPRPQRLSSRNLTSVSPEGNGWPSRRP